MNYSLITDAELDAIFWLALAPSFIVATLIAARVRESLHVWSLTGLWLFEYTIPYAMNAKFYGAIAFPGVFFALTLVIFAGYLTGQIAVFISATLMVISRSLNRRLVKTPLT